MISRLFWIVLLIPAAIILIALSVANRAPVTLTIDPFTANNPLLSFSAPLFVFLFGALLIGLLLGSLVTWMAQGRNRRAAKAANAEVASLQKEAKARDAQVRNNLTSLTSA